MKVGQIYLVKFIDHTCFSGQEGGPLECEAVGRVSKITLKYIELTAWTVRKEGWEHNNEGFCIVRSCITQRPKRLK
jgi:hypothetical protein